MGAAIPRPVPPPPGDELPPLPVFVLAFFAGWGLANLCLEALAWWGIIAPRPGAR
jgi:hypothetical protein